MPKSVHKTRSFGQRVCVPVPSIRTGLGSNGQSWRDCDGRYVIKRGGSEIRRAVPWDPEAELIRVSRNASFGVIDASRRVVRERLGCVDENGGRHLARSIAATRSIRKVGIGPEGSTAEEGAAPYSTALPQTSLSCTPSTP